MADGIISFVVLTTWLFFLYSEKDMKSISVKMHNRGKLTVVRIVCFVTNYISIIVIYSVLRTNLTIDMK